MTTIYFVRHAHSVYTPDELHRPLSEQGKQDAAQVTQLLKMEQIDIILASPYKRAIQTVEGLAHHLQKDIIIEDCFKERLLSSQPVHNFDEALTKLWTDFNFAWEGGESNSIAQQRGVQAILNVLEKHNNKNIVIGTHGNIMVLMMNYFDLKYDFSFWKQLAMPDIYKLVFNDTTLVEVKRLWS